MGEGGMSAMGQERSVVVRWCVRGWHMSSGGGSPVRGVCIIFFVSCPVVGSKYRTRVISWHGQALSNCSVITCNI